MYQYQYIRSILKENNYHFIKILKHFQSELEQNANNVDENIKQKQI